MSPSAIINSSPSSTNGTNKSIVASTQTIISSSNNLIPAWVQPDLARLLRVEHSPGSFASRSVSLVNLPAGAIFARITNPTPATCAYSSVQASRELHIELNCDLVYINHSCRPSLVFNMERWEIRVDAGREGGLNKGDELTFFYPSTEWDMAQKFECKCGEDACAGTIGGAMDMEEEVLAKYWLNGHIEELLEEKRSLETSQSDDR